MFHTCTNYRATSATSTSTSNSVNHSRRIAGTAEEVREAGSLFSPALIDEDDVGGGKEEEGHMDELDHEEDDDDVFNPYLFIAGLPLHASVMIKGKICLPSLPNLNNGSHHRPTLALDLDETLVHCTVEPIAKPDMTFVVTFNGTMYQVYVRKRPYLDYFLETVAKNFEVRPISFFCLLFNNFTDISYKSDDSP